MKEKMNKLTDLELTYAATARCRCGAGLAHPDQSRAEAERKVGDVLHEWELRYCNPHGAVHPAISMEQRAGLKLILINAFLTFSREAEAKAVGELKRELDDEEQVWLGQIAAEELSGNIVKEHFARGRVAGIRVAAALIAQHTEGGKDE